MRQDHRGPFTDSEVAWLHQAWCLSMTHIDGLVKLNLLVTNLFLDVLPNGAQHSTHLSVIVKVRPSVFFLDSPIH